MLNYGNLNDVEFEYLCRDIMQKKLGITLHQYARGRDGGIDLTEDAYQHNIVIQVKHYVHSSVEQLLASLKKEVVKVQALAPKQYYICCSKELSPDKVKAIYLMFAEYMDSSANIITLYEIDEFLNDPANIEILKKHYKLWIESTGILQDVLNTDIFVDCESFLANVKNESKLFVQTDAFNQGLYYLEKNKILMMTGNPGVGKTITSKMLVLYYAATGYRVRFSTNISNLTELKKSLSRNSEVKEIILVDDCFGQAYFNMKESQNEELISLMHYINLSANKRLLLNSRITILKEARERERRLVWCLEDQRCQVHVLDMAAMNYVEKAKIFYNHIVFNNMEAAYFQEVQKDRRYLNIVKHPNYTPRIIEFVCTRYRYQNIPPADYYDFIMRQLDNPREIWKDEYERRLQKVDRILLLTIYSLTDMAVKESMVKDCFERRIAREADIDKTINQYEASLTRLLDSFVQLTAKNGKKYLSMVNPSVNDYLDGRMESSLLEKRELIEAAVSIPQKKRLLTESEFEAFVKMMIVNHQTEVYIFESEDQKNALITYYIGKYKILDMQYADTIRKYIDDPQIWRRNRSWYKREIEIYRLMLQTDICRYYRIQEYIVNDHFKGLIDFLSPDEMLETISLFDSFFTGVNRTGYVKAVSEEISRAIEIYCEDIDADDYDPDVYGALVKATHVYQDSETVDVDEAADYIEEEVVGKVIEEIERLLETLPEDIKTYQDYTEGLNFDIHGAQSLASMYGDDTWTYSSGQQRTSGDAEIDYIFGAQ